MTFSGKATYSAGPNLPELAEDVSDILAIVSPHDTPLLDHLGDPGRSATSTVHEWLEDALLPSSDTLAAPLTSVATSATVAHGERFRPGDQVQAQASREIWLVTAVAGNVLTLIRGYGSTPTQSHDDETTLRIIGNAALEGDEAPGSRFTLRQRVQNYTQIFTASVEVSGSQRAARQLAVADELDQQKAQRLRELARDLENCVINGVANTAGSPMGSATVRRTMRGLLPSLTTNVTDADGASLDEALLNSALRGIWEHAHVGIDTIVVAGQQKRAINGFIAGGRSFASGSERFKDLVSVYESDFGVCRVLLSRFVPVDAVLLLDSSRIDVLPLTGRSFQYQPLASRGDSFAGQLIGEYTLELRNENAHGVIRGLA